MRPLLLFLLVGSLLWPEGADSVVRPSFEILFPLDGAILTPAWDRSPEPGSQVPLIGLAPPGAEVRVNGKKAGMYSADAWQQFVQLDTLGASFSREGLQLQVNYPLGIRRVELAEQVPFFCLVEAQKPVVDVEIRALLGQEMLFHTCVFYYREDSRRTYAVTVDDAADLFAEIARRERRYTSLFDHPTFAWLRWLHQQYGAVFSFYLFSQGTVYHTFNLSQMPDRFRAEWEENASWLRLGFHASSYDPPRPYRNAGYAQAQSDLAAIRDQVLRFAGEQTWDPFARIHFWSGSREACRAWRDQGIRGLYGAPTEYRSYYLTAEQDQFLKHFDFWRDHGEGLVFAQTDLWVERDFSLAVYDSLAFAKEAEESLDRLRRAPLAAQQVHLFTHESFLLPANWYWKIPERLEILIAQLAARGYAPCLEADDPFLASLPPVPPAALRLDYTGPSTALAWDHLCPQGNCQYLVYRKELSIPPGPWTLVGKTRESRWTDNWQSGECAYRVFAKDRQGRMSGGSPVLKVRFSRTSSPTKGPFSLLSFDSEGRADLKKMAAVLLEPNFPNPFNAATTIRYQLANPDLAQIEIFDLQGQKIRSWKCGLQPAGFHTLLWDGTDEQDQAVASGVYLVRLQTSVAVAGQRLLLVR